jgi:hypothetical protein
MGRVKVLETWFHLGSSSIQRPIATRHWLYEKEKNYEEDNECEERYDSNSNHRSASNGALQATAQDDQSCSNASLKGTYGFQFTGSIPGVFAIGGVARVLFDGQGNFTQSDDVQILVSGQAPVVILDRPGSGTYTVNPDCTGSETLNAGGKVSHSRFVLVNHGKEVFDMGSDPGVVVTGVGKKQ